MTGMLENTHRSIKILIVEGSPLQLENLRVLLEDSAFTVISAVNGKEGLAMARANSIDLVISDTVMPEMDGYELCKALRKEDDLRQVPVILLDSLNDPHDVIRGLESGANNFIFKPYDDQVLLDRIQNILVNQEIRKAYTSEMGINIFFAGQRFFITADRLQILDLLLSTYENAVSQNSELISARDELQLLNAHLEERVSERTAELAAEMVKLNRAQEQEHHRNSILHAIRSINQLIILEKDPVHLIQEVCEILTTTQWYRSVWIVLIGQKGIPSSMVQSGWGEDFEQLTELMSCSDRPSCWRKAQAAENGFVLLDPREDCAGCLWKDAVGSGKTGVVTLRHGDQLYGMLGICYEHAAKISSEDASLFMEMAGDLGLALHGIATMQQRNAYAQIVANSQDAMALVDRNYVYLEANPSYAHLVSLDRRSIIGCSVQEILGEDLFQKKMKSYMDRCFQGETVLFDSTWSLPDLKTIFIEVQYSPCRASDGSITSLAVSMRDVTERIRARSRDQLSRDVLESLNRHGTGIDPIQDILHLIRNSTGIESVGIRLKEGDDFPYYATNGFPEQFLQMERFLCERNSAGEIMRDSHGNAILECMCGNVLCGRTDPKFSFFTEKGSFWTNSTTDLLASTSETNRQARILNQCNGEGYESLALIPLRSGDETIGLLQFNDHRRNQFAPELIHFFEGLGNSIGVSISRTQSEAQVMALSRFPEENPSPVLRIDPDGTILYANPSAGPLMNYWGCELGQRLPEDWATLADEVIVSGERHRIEVECEGRSYTLDITQIQSGRYINIYGNDITDRKRTEVEREKLEEQLRVSQKMEAIGSLAGGIAHDFNNLLSVIQGYTDLVMEGLREGDPLKIDLKEVQNATGRAVSLTRQLLAFSRKQVLQPVPLSLNDIAECIEKMLRRVLGEDIDLIQILDPDLHLILADPGQMEQVLMNLVVNARDAMPGGGKLTIETSNVDIDEKYVLQHVVMDPGQYIMLAITDTGCGMDKRTLEKIFEPFFTTKEKGKGTGLGLSMVYGIIRQSGGHVLVYSESGQGTTFKIYLPREMSTETKTTIQPTKTVISTGVETILVVEDEQAVRILTRRILEKAGYKVLTASNGEEALLLCEALKDRIHLVLTDVVMPQMSGRMLIDHLMELRPGIKVLYMSGFTDHAIQHHGALDPGINFIGKPFTPADLTHRIRELLDAPEDSGKKP